DNSLLRIEFFIGMNQQRFGQMNHSSISVINRASILALFVFISSAYQSFISLVDENQCQIDHDAGTFSDPDSLDVVLLTSPILKPVILETRSLTKGLEHLIKIILTLSEVISCEMFPFFFIGQ